MSITIKMRINMNKIFFIYIFFLVLILCASCDWFNESEKQEIVDVTNMEGISPELKQRLNEQDSLYSELVLKIDSLTTGLNKSKGYIEELQSEIRKLKSPSRIFTGLALFSLLLSIVAVVLSIIRANKKVDKREVDDLTKQMVKNHVKALEYRINRAESNIKEIGKGSSASKAISSSNPVDKKISDLDVRLSRIERNNSVESPNQSSFVDQTSSDAVTIQKAETNRKEYAKANSGKFLVQITDSQQEGCVYVINFINKEEGKFDIISLAKIKPVNDIMDVIELAPGSCSLENATNCSVIDRGLCKKVEGKPAWEVTKKLIIKVTK